ncbi:IS110 family transposase [Ruegeria jejuensis]|uniref:IS110 family transposase n=1 Tax=Ruegeria jejuensis TaxID=3233338 RepID=UPI00355C0F64
MISAKPMVGIDVSRDWLDGFCLPGGTRFRLANSAEGHEELISIIRQQPGPVQIGFEATGGQEWVLWTMLVAADIDARQLPPAQVKAFAKSKGTRAKTDRIDRCPAVHREAMSREGRNSLPSSCSSDQGRDGGCRTKNYAFSEP